MVVKNDKNEAKVEVKAELKPKYRYFCDACTGTAFVTYGEELPTNIVCKVCNKTLIYRKQNLIKI